MNDRDPLESAFELLNARSPERTLVNPELEEKLMKVHGENGSPKRSRFVAVAAAILVCIAIAGVTEAATGIIRNHVWQAVLVDEDGNRYEVEIELQDDDPSGDPNVPAKSCLLYTSPSPRDLSTSRMPSSA